MNRVRWTTTAGVVGPAIGLGAVLLATLVSPSFGWAASALSDMGRPGEPTAPLFNGGLVVGAVVTLPFVHRLWTVAENAVQRAGTVLFAGATVSLGLIGVLHLPRTGHGVVALGFYSLGTATMWVHGTGSVLAGGTRRGLASIWTGIGHLLGWVVWAAAVAPAYFAVVEAVGAVVVGGWTIATARRVLHRSRRS